MVVDYPDLQKFADAKRFAQEHNCYVKEVDGVYKLYRKGERRSFYLGQRKTVGALLAFVRQACVVV